MIQGLKDILKRWSEEGIKLPFAYDAESGKPSITLLFYWITWSLAVISLIVLHFGKVAISATAMSLGFVLTAFIMYRLRKLDKVKIDVKNQSVELDDDNQEETK